METIIALHRRATAAVERLVAHVRPADLTRPTPCAGWDLRTLLEHMTGQDHGFADSVRGAAVGVDVGEGAFAPRPLEPDPATAHARGAAEILAAFAAGDPARPVLLAEFGHRPPLEVVIRMHLVDTVVHGWDAAVALGRGAVYVTDLDADVVAATLAVAEQVPVGAAREEAGGAFAADLPVPPSAGPWERTLLLLGRDPALATTDPELTSGPRVP